MLKTVLAAALAAGLVVAGAAPAAIAASGMRVAEAAATKPLTPQQQKMKDCAAGWKEEKAKTGVKGGTAYRKFMSGCLKKTPT